jgi:hypothetical protein
VLARTRNVRGTWDVIDDLVVGVLATAIYTPGFQRLGKGRDNRGQT